jgi:S-adenosyl methyltransferase
VADESAQATGLAGIDTSVAHPARVYDYWLGGTTNFPADREAAERVLAATPGLRERVRANRAFLARAVRYLAGEASIRQFLDIGTGIPAADNTHEVARAVGPDARVVYVDNDHCNLGCAHQGSTRNLRRLPHAARALVRVNGTAIISSRPHGGHCSLSGLR